MTMKPFVQLKRLTKVEVSRAVVCWSAEVMVVVVLSTGDHGAG